MCIFRTSLTLRRSFAESRELSRFEHQKTIQAEVSFYEVVMHESSNTFDSSCQLGVFRPIFGLGIVPLKNVLTECIFLSLTAQLRVVKLEKTLSCSRSLLKTALQPHFALYSTMVAIYQTLCDSGISEELRGALASEDMIELVV